MLGSRKIRIAVFGAAGLAAMVGLTLGGLHTSATKQFVLRKAVQLLRQQGIGLNASRLDYNLLRGRIELSHVRVQSLAAPGLPPIAEADRVSAQIDLHRIFQGWYHFGDAGLDNLRVHLVIDSEGRNNVPRLPEKKTESSAVDFFVKQLRIAGGEFRFEDQRQQISAVVPLKDIDITGDAPTRKYHLALQTLEGSRVIRAGRVLPVSGISAKANFADPALDVRAQAGLDMRSLAEFTGTPKMSGTVGVLVTAGGTLNALTAKALVHGNGLAVDRFDRVDLDATAAYDASTATIQLQSAEVRSPWANLRGRANLDLGPGARESRAELSAVNVDLGTLSVLAGSSVRVASIGSFEGEARWPGMRLESVAGTASMNFRPSGATAKHALPVEASAHARFTGHLMNLNLDEIRAAGASMAGQVALADWKALSGDLRADVGSLSNTLSATEAVLGKPAGSLIGTPVEGSLSATARLSGSLDAPAATVHLEAPDLAVSELHGAAVEVSANYAPKSISIERAEIRWQKQLVSAQGTIALGAGQPLKLSAQSTGLSVPVLLGGLNLGAVPIAGDLDLNLGVDGTVDAPEATLTVSGRGLSAYGQWLGQLAARANLRGRKVELNEFRLAGDAVQATGAYDLDNGRYQAQARAKDFDLTGVTLADGTTLRGMIQLDATGRGTMDDPSGELKLTADRVQVGERNLGRFDLAVKAANQQVDVDTSVPQFHLTGSAKTGVHGPYPATVQLRLAGSELSQLPFQMDQRLGGTVSAIVDWSGELQNYQKGAAKAQISQLDAQWDGEPIRAEGPITARYSAGVLTLDKTTLVAAGSRIEAAGVLPLEPTAGEGNLQLNAQLDLPRIARLAPAANLDLQGTATVSGEIRGTLQHLDPTLAIALESPRVASPAFNPAISNATLKAHVRAGALEIEAASAMWGTASITASGVVPFSLLPADLPVDIARRAGVARFTADLRGLDLTALQGAPAGLSGSVSAHLDAESADTELRSLKATLSLPVLHAAVGSYSIAQDGASEIALEKGVVSVRHFRLTGPSTEVTLAGTAQLDERQALDLRLDGKLDASIAAAFTDALRARGATEIHAALGGSLPQPQATGYVQLADGQFSIQDPRMAIDGLNLRVNLEGERATIARLEGQINGGSLTGRGSIAFKDGSPKDSDISLRAQDVYLDYPKGLKTVSDVRLQLKSLESVLALRGSVLIKDGGFKDDLNFDKGILAAATAPRTPDLTQERKPLLDSVRFNVVIATQNPIIVQNNLAKAEISTQLVLLGSAREPGLAGRLIIEQGSELTLQERRYQVNRGVVTFTSERRIEPNLDIEATTSASNFDITLRLSGTPADTKTELTSNPALPEPDILAVLVTGKTLDEVRGQEFQVAQTQMLSYLTGRVGSTVGRQVERVTGLSRVRIEPNLIAAETTPGARLTVGQDFTRQLKMVYSMDLVDSSDQIWIVEYSPIRRFSSRAARQSDGSFRFDFHQDLRFGGIAAQKRAAPGETRRIGQVSLSGATRFPEAQVLGKLKVSPGDRYDYFKLRKGLDRITQMYLGEGLLEASVRLAREQKDRTVNLNLKVEPGARVDFVFEGATVPKGMRKQLRRTWSSGVFDAQRTEESAGVLQSWLIGDGYLTPHVEPRISKPAEEQKRVVFEIARGPRFEKVEWAFEGAQGVEPKRLRSVIETQNLSTDVYTKPERVTYLLTQFYHEQGYLDAVVGKPRNELTPETQTGRVVFPVSEGPLYRVGAAQFEGNDALTAEELREIAPLSGGEEFRPVLRENAVQRLRETYWARGYNDVTVDAEVRRIPERGVVDLDFRITENARAVVSDIVVEGRRRTSEGLIRSQVQLKAGEPVNLQQIAESRRKLYNTGAFATVDIAREDLGTAPNADRLVRLRVKVVEVQPLELRYGAYYDTERGPGGMVDISNRNFLGAARVLGLRGRYDSDLHEVRLNFSQPLLAGYPIKTVAGTYLRREINAATELTSGFDVDRRGVYAQQEISLGHIIVNYGYKIERSHTYDTGPDPIFDVRLRIASLTATLTRDTRDDLLDATRGSFFSNAMQFSPESLGSQVRFIKYFGQYFRYFPLQKPRVELFTNQVLRPRLVYATGIRIGVGTGLGGQEIPLSERFFAGGSTTIRGFAQNSVGPETGGIVLPGGNGMLVLNNELRFPMFKMLDGVGFVDVGNVYPKVSDFSLSNLRSAAGLGVRVRTPWFLLRLDYGFKLDRRPGETAGRLFFSIGQAF